MSDPKLDALARVPLFAHCGQKELEFLASRTDEVSLPAGRKLIEEGSPADSFFVLLEGEASVTIDGMARPVLGPGDFFGEISMLDRGPATATVASRTPVRAMVMSHGQFRDAIKSNEQLLAAVMMVMAERLRRDAMARSSA
jgi:CRP/FNR family transcriptional regulator, cyclic AMP receptor protein